MRTYFSKLTSLFVLAALILISACSDDEQPIQLSGDLTINNADYTITNAYISSYSEFKDGPDINGDGKADLIEMKSAILSFTTGGLAVGLDSEGDEDFIGTGSLLFIYLPQILVMDNANYPVGTYTNQLDADFYSFNDTERWNRLSQHKSGTLTITKSGSVYTVEGELVDRTSGLENCSISFQGQLTDFPGLRL